MNFYVYFTDGSEQAFYAKDRTEARSHVLDLEYERGTTAADVHYEDSTSDTWVMMCVQDKETKLITNERRFLPARRLRMNR